MLLRSTFDILHIYVWLCVRRSSHCQRIQRERAVSSRASVEVKDPWTSQHSAQLTAVLHQTRRTGRVLLSQLQSR